LAEGAGKGHKPVRPTARQTKDVNGGVVPGNAIIELDRFGIQSRYPKTPFGTPLTSSLYSMLAGDFEGEKGLVAPQGFEPRLSESESLVLPLNEGATG
jgi:hypothetical protein